MRTALVLAILVCCITSASVAGFDEPSYESTLALLDKLETAPANGALRQLFKEAYRRRDGLVRALDNPNVRVSVNAQRVIEYVGLPELTTRLAAWRKSVATSGGTVARPNLDVLDAPLASHTFRGDPVDIVREHLFKSEPGSYRVVTRNKEAKTVLVEVVFGEAFTEGWHVVLRNDDTGWRVIVKANVWVS